MDTRPGRRLRGWPFDLWWASIRMPYSDWFISKFIDFLTPSSLSLFVFFRLLLYPTVLWVLRRRFEGMSQVSGETARWSLTFDSSIALRNVWLSDRILNQYQELTLGFEFLRASWLTQDWWSDIDFWTKNAVNECLNRLIQSRHPSLRQTFWLVCHEEVELPVNQFALSLLMKEIRFPLMDMRLKWPLVQHSSHKWKQIRDRDYHHFWSGCQRLVKFQILRIFVWTMACHNYYLTGFKTIFKNYFFLMTNESSSCYRYR